MGIHISISTTEGPLTDEDKAIIAAVAAAVANGTVAVAAQATAPTPAKASTPAPAKKAAAAKPKPAPEPEPEEAEEDEDLTGGGEVTIADAVAKATEFINAGRQAEIKTTLTDIGVAKVGQLKGDQIQEFIDALDALA